MTSTSTTSAAMVITLRQAYKREPMVTGEGRRPAAAREEREVEAGILRDPPSATSEVERGAFCCNGLEVLCGAGGSGSER